MRTIQHDTIVPLSVGELLRLRRWYQVMLHHSDVDPSAADVVLDAKLRAIRYDMQDRTDARCYDNADRTRHVGPERRSRVPQVRARIVRAAPRVTHA